MPCIDLHDGSTTKVVSCRRRCCACLLGEGEHCTSCVCVRDADSPLLLWKLYSVFFFSYFTFPLKVCICFSLETSSFNLKHSLSTVHRMLSIVDYFFSVTWVMVTELQLCKIMLKYCSETVFTLLLCAASMVTAVECSTAILDQLTF